MRAFLYQLKIASVCFLILWGSLGPVSVDANPLGELLGGDAKTTLEGMLGGTQEGGSQSSADPLSLIGKAMKATENTALGPMGRFYLGRKLSAQVLGLYASLPPDHQSSMYAHDVVMTLVGSSHFAENYRTPVVVVLDDDGLINAFAAPGNFVFVSTGMLNFVDSEDELAFVLAHEIAHIELDHGLNAIKKKQSADLFKDFAGNKFEGLGDLLDIAENGFSADLEGEADTRGAEIAASAGYDPQAGVAVIDKLEALQGRKHATGYPVDRKSAVSEVASRFEKNSESGIRVRLKRFNERLNR